MGHLLQLLFAECTIFVFIQPQELLLHGVQLILGGTQPRDKTQHNLLELAAILVLDKVHLDVQRYLILKLAVGGQLGDPGVLEQVLYRGPCLLVAVQALQYEVFCLAGDIPPVPLRKRKLLLQDILVDMVDVLAIKGRLAA